MEEYLKYLVENLSKPTEEITVNEMSFYVSKNIQQVLDIIPRVTKKELILRSQPGDIMVAFTADKDLKDKFGASMFAKVLAAFQGSPYTSSKLVLDSNYVGGYGISTSGGNPDNVVEKVPIALAVRERSEVALIRVNTSLAVKKKAVNWVKSKIGLSYADSDLLKSTWDRFTNRKFFPFFKDKTLDKEQLKALQTPLFCSTLISLAYYVGGYKQKFNNMNHFDNWPRDFILDENTEKVCRIDYVK